MYIQALLLSLIKKLEKSLEPLQRNFRWTRRRCAAFTLARPIHLPAHYFFPPTLTFRVMPLLCHRLRPIPFLSTKAGFISRAISFKSALVKDLIDRLKNDPIPRGHPQIFLPDEDRVEIQIKRNTMSGFSAFMYDLSKPSVFDKDQRFEIKRGKDLKQNMRSPKSFYVFQGGRLILDEEYGKDCEFRLKHSYKDKGVGFVFGATCRDIKQKGAKDMCQYVAYLINHCTGEFEKILECDLNTAEGKEARIVMHLKFCNETPALRRINEDLYRKLGGPKMRGRDAKKDAVNTRFRSMWHHLGFENVLRWMVIFLGASFLVISEVTQENDMDGEETSFLQ